MLLVGSAEDLVLVVDSQGERQLRSLRDTGMGDRLLSAIGCEVRVSQYNFMGRRPVTGYRLEFDVDGSADVREAVWWFAGIGSPPGTGQAITFNR